MKFSSQEEYGLRCLLQVARSQSQGGVTISEISEAERITTHHAAKLLRILRQSGFLQSIRGHAGGYILAGSADKIRIGEVLNALGGRLYDKEFCDKYAGNIKICTHSIDCAMRSLWSSLQDAVDNVLLNLTLQDLIQNNEQALANQLYSITDSELN